MRFTAQDIIMKSIEYNLIALLPPLLITFAPFIAVWVMMVFYRTRLDRITRWIAANAFSEIFKEKKKNTGSPRETRWLFKGIDLTAEKKTLSETLTSFSCLFIMMFGVVVAMFWQLLLLEISNSCDEDDQTKDCFEYKLWSLKPQDPINCSSAAVKNGKIQIICYKIVFNFGVASGASYGAFKLSMFAVTVGTSAILMVKKPKILRAIQVIFVLLFLGALVSVIVVMSVLPSGVAFMSDNWVTILQIMTVAAIAFCFLFEIPWKELIAIKAARDNQEVYGLENPAADTDAN